MNERLFERFALGVLAMCLGGVPRIADAQFFSYNSMGDVLAGFRKTGIHQGNYELVVDLGNVTNFIALQQGATLTISNFSPQQLTDAFPDGYQDLQWSVFSTFPGLLSWSTSLGSFPQATIWYTLARTNLNTPTQAPVRLPLLAQTDVRQPILGVGGNAMSISEGLGVTNADNNSVLVREPVSGNALFDLTSSIGDPTNPSLGDFGGQGINFSVENVIPDTFSSPAQSDFYQSCPASTGGRGGGTYIDPITGLTNGPAYRVGFFTFSPNGTMTFMRTSTNSVTPTPPPPPQLTVGRSGSTTMISFGTTNSAIYTLYYTNAAGLTTPVTSWASAGSVAGDGTTKSLSDATTDAVRFYRVGAH